VTTESWVFSIIPTFLLLGLAWFARRQFGSWLYPGAFFSLFWFVALLAPLVLAPDFDFWPGAAWWILLFSWIVYVGASFGHGFRDLNTAPAARDMPTRMYHMRWGKQMLVLFALLGLIGVQIIISARGVPLWGLFSPTVVAQIAQENASLRYSAGESPPFAARVLNALLYAGGLLGGAWWRVAAAKRARWLGFLPLAVMFIQATVLNTRSNLFIFFTFMLSSYCSLLILQQKQRAFLRKRHLVQILLAVLIFASIIATFQIIRESTEDRRSVPFDNVVTVSLIKTRASAFGSPIVFSDWLKREWLNFRSPRLGAATLGGIFEVIGIEERTQGQYTEFVALGNEEMSNSNVATVFRALIEDFTLPGTLIVLLCFGFVSGLAYRKLLQGYVGWLSILALFYIFTVSGYLVSAFFYNACVFGWIVFAVYVRFGFRSTTSTDLKLIGSQAQQAWKEVGPAHS